MNKLFLTTTMVLALGLSMPAYAHDGEVHESAAEHRHDDGGIHTEASQITDNTSALKVIQDGVSFMNEAIISQQADLFNDGATMDKLHDITVHIEEAAKFIESQPSQRTEAEKTRLLSALKQITKTATDFHIATHDRNLEKAKAELKKTQGALKLVEANLK